MRFTVIAFAALAVAATCAFAANETEEALDAIEVIHGGPDPFGDDTTDEPVRRSKKHHHKSSRSSKYVSTSPSKNAKKLNGDTQITWYASHDLKNPECGGNGWNPTNGNHIGAIMYGWDLGDGDLKCGKFVQLCNEHKTPHKCLQVRIVDKCSGCKKNHVDLTKSAFKHLSNSGSLDEGVTKGLKLYSNSNPNPWDYDLFGPLKLKG